MCVQVKYGFCCNFLHLDFYLECSLCLQLAANWQLILFKLLCEFSLALLLVLVGHKMCSLSLICMYLSSCMCTQRKKGKCVTLLT